MLSLNKLKTFLGITDTSKDSLLTDCINGAEAEFGSMLNRSIASQSITNEYHFIGDINRPTERISFTNVTPFSNEAGITPIFTNLDSKYYPVITAIDTKENPIIAVTTIQYLQTDTNTWADLIDADTIANTVIYDNYRIILTKGYTFPYNTLIKLEYSTGYIDIDEWTASRAYLVNDLVSYNSNYYKCNTGNSDATFTIAKWDVYTPTASVAPADWIKAIKYIATMEYMDSPASGKAAFMKASENVSGQAGGGFSYDKKFMTDYIEKIASADRELNV